MCSVVTEGGGVEQDAIRRAFNSQLAHYGRTTVSCDRGAGLEGYKRNEREP